MEKVEHKETAENRRAKKNRVEAKEKSAAAKSAVDGGIKQAMSSRRGEQHRSGK
jgi:hypothetical protein